MTRRLWRWLALSCLLALGYLGSGQVVPLYDGVGFPDEPYRYVQAPAGAKHGPAAKPAQANAPATGGTNTSELDLQTAEQGPQLLLDLPLSAINAPSNASKITMTATPLAPDAQPADGSIDGNVYRINVGSDAGPARFGPSVGDSDIYLRAASMTPAPPVMEHRTTPGAPWTALKTGQGGADVLIGAFQGAGDYALVHQHGAKPVSSQPSQETLLLLLLGGLITLVAAATLLVRRSARDQAESGDRSHHRADRDEDMAR